MVHANSPMKRLDWQRECTRKRTKKYRNAAKSRTSGTEKRHTFEMSGGTEKRHTSEMSGGTEKRHTPSKSSVTSERFRVSLAPEATPKKPIKNRYLSSPELSEGQASDGN